MALLVQVIPRDTPSTGGNATSAARVASGLKHFGWTVVTRREGENLPAGDVVLAWNAVTVGLRLIAAGIEPARIITVWTGTDLWDGVNQNPEIGHDLADVAGHVTFTADARERVLTVLPQAAERIWVIPPGVDDTTFQPGPVLADDRPVALWAGGMRSVKRPEWAIALGDAVRARGIPLELWMVGPIREAEAGQQVYRLAASRPWVRVWGEVDHARMPELYCRSTVVLNTSRSEGVSNALMEAMACGACVIATRIPGNAAVIDDGRTGWLFGNVAEGADRIWRAVSHRRRRHLIGLAARHWIQKTHGAKPEAAAYAHVLGRVITLFDGPMAENRPE